MRISLKGVFVVTKLFIILLLTTNATMIQSTLCPCSGGAGSQQQKSPANKGPDIEITISPNSDIKVDVTELEVTARLINQPTGSQIKSFRISITSEGDEKQGEDKVDSISPVIRKFTPKKQGSHYVMATCDLGLGDNNPVGNLSFRAVKQAVVAPTLALSFDSKTNKVYLDIVFPDDKNAYSTNWIKLWEVSNSSNPVQDVNSDGGVIFKLQYSIIRSGSYTFKGEAEITINGVPSVINSTPKELKIDAVVERVEPQFVHLKFISKDDANPTEVEVLHRDLPSYAKVRISGINDADKVADPKLSVEGLGEIKLNVVASGGGNGIDFKGEVLASRDQGSTGKEFITRASTFSMIYDSKPFSKQGIVFKIGLTDHRSSIIFLATEDQRIENTDLSNQKEPDRSLSDNRVYKWKLYKNLKPVTNVEGNVVDGRIDGGRWFVEKISGDIELSSSPDNNGSFEFTKNQQNKFLVISVSLYEQASNSLLSRRVIVFGNRTVTFSYDKKKFSEVDITKLIPGAKSFFLHNFGDLSLAYVYTDSFCYVFKYSADARTFTSIASVGLLSAKPDPYATIKTALSYFSVNNKYYIAYFAGDLIVYDKDKDLLLLNSDGGAIKIGNLQGNVLSTCYYKQDIDSIVCIWSDAGTATIKKGIKDGVNSSWNPVKFDITPENYGNLDFSPLSSFKLTKSGAYIFSGSYDYGGETAILPLSIPNTSGNNVIHKLGQNLQNPDQQVPDYDKYILWKKGTSMKLLHVNDNGVTEEVSGIQLDSNVTSQGLKSLIVTSGNIVYLIAGGHVVKASPTYSIVTDVTHLNKCGIVNTQSGVGYEALFMQGSTLFIVVKKTDKQNRQGDLVNVGLKLYTYNPDEQGCD